MWLMRRSILWACAKLIVAVHRRCEEVIHEGKVTDLSQLARFRDYLLRTGKVTYDSDGRKIDVGGKDDAEEDDEGGPRRTDEGDTGQSGP